MTAFITGSRAYGTPREDSDIDLVISVSPADSEILWRLTEETTGSVRFGRLNLIICEQEDPEKTPIKFFTWRRVTDALKALSLIKPVTRDEAVSAFQKEGIGQNYGAREESHD